MNGIGFFAICQWYILHGLLLTQKDTPCLAVGRNIRISSHILDADSYLFSSCSFSRIVSFLPHNAAHSAAGLQGFVIHGAEIQLPPTPSLLSVWPAGATQNAFTLFPIWGHSGSWWTAVRAPLWNQPSQGLELPLLWHDFWDKSLIRCSSWVARYFVSILLKSPCHLAAATSGGSVNTQARGIWNQARSYHSVIHA